MTLQGRFPANDIISLLDINAAHNLAESTSRDLFVGEIIDLLGLETLRGVRLGYGSSAGSATLREAIGGLCGVPAEQVLTTTGAALGLALLALELCRPGDEAIVATPCFGPSRDVFRGAGVDLREVPHTFSSGYRLDAQRLAAACGPRTRLVSIASPQNPSGVRVDRGTLCALRDAVAAVAPDAWLFVDETYREACYGDDPTPPSAAGLGGRILTGGSLSKAYGAPGLRVGWLTVPDPELRARLVVARMNLVLSGSPLDEALAEGLIRQREAVLAPRRALLAEALAIVAAWHHEERARVSWVRPEGGALCCFQLNPDVFSESDVQRFWSGLSAEDLQLASGTWFGASSRVFRLGFGFLPLDRLRPALAAVSRALSTSLRTTRG